MFPKSPRIKSKATYDKYKRTHPDCEVCGRLIFLGPDHIIFRSQGGSDVEENLIALCRKHHLMAHGLDQKTIPREYREYLQTIKENHAKEN